jgi:hypothetical protein
MMNAARQVLPIPRERFDSVIVHELHALSRNKPVP